MHMPNEEVFDDLDDQAQSMIGSLHLDADDEPTRRGAASRANSVRFDESALHGSHFGGHNGRHSGDFGPSRPTSGMGGHALERSLSHKSDGRHSSAAHSVHSMQSGVSGRASSLGLDTNFSMGGHDDDPPIDIPEPPPGIFYLGSVPSIIRCWLNTNFTSRSLLYAVICTGSQKSTVDFSLIKELDYSTDMRRDADGVYRISLPVFLAEARVTQSNSRSPTPAPQLPSIMATFEVTGLDQPDRTDASGAIRIFIGSDTLRMHSADILLSRNLMTLYGNDRDKLSVPFVRPEDDSMFKNLATTNVTVKAPKLNAGAAEFISTDRTSKYAPQEVGIDPSRVADKGTEASDVASPTQNNVLRVEKRSPALAVPETRPDADLQAPEEPKQTETQNQGKESSSASGPTSRRESNTAILGSWRQAAATNGSERVALSDYQPPGRTRSMKVLKPSKSSAALSSASTSSVRTGPSYEQAPLSRTSGEQRRRSQGAVLPAETGSGASTSGGSTTGGNANRNWDSKRSLSGGGSANGGKVKPVQIDGGGGKGSIPPTPRSATNPLGSASAFSFFKAPTTAGGGN